MQGQVPWDLVGMSSPGGSSFSNLWLAQYINIYIFDPELYIRMFHDQPFDKILKSYTPYASLDTYRKSMQETPGL